MLFTRWINSLTPVWSSFWQALQVCHAGCSIVNNELKASLIRAPDALADVEGLDMAHLVDIVGFK